MVMVFLCCVGFERKQVQVDCGATTVVVATVVVVFVLVMSNCDVDRVGR